MKHFPLGVFLLVALFLGCEQRENPQAVKTALMEKNRKFAEAFKSKNIDAAMANYWNSPDLVVMTPDEELVRGYDAAKSSFQKMMQGMETRDFQLVDSRIDVFGDIATDWGRFRWTAAMPNGQEMTINGRYTTIWQKKNGDWLITIDHGSVPMPPAPLAGADAIKQ